MPSRAPSSAPVAHARIESFRRGTREILSDVTLTIAAGEHWAIIGPNGSGKTSLLRILSGYEWPTRGSVAVLDRAFGKVDLRELRKRIGLVSSALESRLSTQLLPEATALDVALSGIEASIGLWRAFDEAERQRARDALAAVRAEHLSGARYDVLSQGERQRVLIARALVNRPALLILDEACGGLDPVARESFLDDLEHLAARDDAPTLVFVTHHAEEIPPFVGHALLLSGGRTVASGPIDQVLTGDLVTRAFGAPCEVLREIEHHAGRARRRFTLRMKRTRAPAV